MKKRSFLKALGLGSLAAITPNLSQLENLTKPRRRQNNGPLFISTWNHGKDACKKAWEISMKENYSILDAVEQGVRVVESDPENTSVGLGGLPDRDGIVTLDACIMSSEGHSGAVCALEEIENPISVARLVMEETPHVMLAGKGAQEFAINQGFKKTNLLTDKAEKRYKQWLENSSYEPKINEENHDTVSLLGIDDNGNLSGACTTSGVAFKMHGRVGDSPIIGSGLYVDNEIGAAAATGVGEYVIQCVSSFHVVEMMRSGLGAEEAAKKALEIIVKRFPDKKDFQVAIIALSKTGDFGAYSIHPGFTYAIKYLGKDVVIKANSLY